MLFSWLAILANQNLGLQNSGTPGIARKGQTQQQSAGISTSKVTPSNTSPKIKILDHAASTLEPHCVNPMVIRGYNSDFLTFSGTWMLFLPHFFRVAICRHVPQQWLKDFHQQQGCCDLKIRGKQAKELNTLPSDPKKQKKLYFTCDPHRDKSFCHCF